jgi:CBS domain-containing protein
LLFPSSLAEGFLGRKGRAMHTLQQIVEMKGCAVHATQPTAMVIEAVEQMCRLHVRALVVGELDEPLGIIAERDVLERVVLRGLDPKNTPVEAAMTTPLFSLPADSPPSMALEFMRQHKLHQVPIVGDESLIGVLSSGDLMRWAAQAQEHEILTLTEYFCGKYPG